MHVPASNDYGELIRQLAILTQVTGDLKLTVDQDRDAQERTQITIRELRADLSLFLYRLEGHTADIAELKKNNPIRPILFSGY